MGASRFSKASNFLRQSALSTLYSSAPSVEERSIAIPPSSAQKVSSRSRSSKRKLQRDDYGTLTAAKNIGTLIGRRSFGNSVGKKNGKNDRNDYYRFFLGRKSNFSLSLLKLKANADVQLFDGNRQAIATSNRPGKSAESIVRPLDPGTYYVRVYPRGGATAYSLVLQGNRIQVPPSVSSVAAPPTLTGQSPYNFSVTYSDDFTIDSSSIDGNDILVTGPNGFQQKATLVNITFGVGRSDTENYRLAAPQGGWKVSNNGSYQLVLQPGEVRDYEGNFVASATIGQFSVSIDALPQASSVFGRITTSGSSPYTFSATYSDDIELNGSSIDSNDILATGPYGFQQKATLVNKTPLSATSYTANYQLTAPPGGWAASSSGSYDLVLQPNQISDSGGQFAASGRIGGLTVNIGFNKLYGFGLVDASKAVARAIGKASFPDVPNGSFPDAEKAWQVDAVNAPEVWAKGFRGQGVVVAVLDTGVDYTNSFLSKGLWTNSQEIPFNNIDDDKNGYVDDVLGWDFVNGDNNPIDSNSHGTFVAGIIADSTSGIAPDARVMPIQVGSDAGGSAYEADIAKGIYYAVQNGANIINISYGSPKPTFSGLPIIGASISPELQQALKFADQNHVFVVAAAGNEGASVPDGIADFLAANSYGIAVGATDQIGRFADFSNAANNNIFGSPLSYLVAPGVDVYSDSFDPFTFAPTFEPESGTSFSAPAVAAIAALMLSANPNLTSDQIEQILIDTANPNVFT